MAICLASPQTSSLHSWAAIAPALTCCWQPTAYLRRPRLYRPGLSSGFWVLFMFQGFLPFCISFHLQGLCVPSGILTSTTPTLYRESLGKSAVPSQGQPAWRRIFSLVTTHLQRSNKTMLLKRQMDALRASEAQLMTSWAGISEDSGKLQKCFCLILSPCRFLCSDGFLVSPAETHLSAGPLCCYRPAQLVCS